MAKILLVEDDNNLREIYEARLQAEGYDIVSARDGEEALTVAMKERPDLIISDVMMPKISGFDMLDIIRSTEETKNAKVIMMTALSQAEDKERATKLGADRYLVKSQVTLEDVAKVAREVLNGDSGAPEAAETPAEAPTTTSPTAPAEPTTTPTVVPATVAVPTVPAPADDPVTAPAEPVVTTAAPTVTPPADPVVATPVATPTTDDSSTSPAIDAISPAPVASVDEIVGSKDAIEQSVEDEQSAIAAQIESFIEVKKNDSLPTEEPKVAETTSPTPEEVKTEETPKPEEPTVEAASPPVDASEKTGKKVIQPISDPTASKGPDLENLLKKEEEKEQMAEIAKSVASEKAEVADELSAEATLRAAARQPSETASEVSDSTTPEVNITENGDLKVQSPPDETVQAPDNEPAVETSDAPKVDPTKPVIPHSNGTSMDGVTPSASATVAQPVQTPPAGNTVDPNSIAL
jgi:CheY-like chemotaxis protein